MPGLKYPIEGPGGAFANRDITVIQDGRTYMAFKAYNLGNMWFDITGGATGWD